MAQARPDQVTRLRNGRTTVQLGTVTENALSGLRIERDGKSDRYDAAEIVAIQWGDVPPSFQDAQIFEGRRDWANAVAKYRVAAGDASARPVVQAAARLGAAESLLAWGASDPNQYASAISECEAFLAANATDRAVPRARWVQARATWLAGDAAKAASLFRSIYEEGLKTPTPEGWDREASLITGLEAAQAYLDAKDTGQAREIFAGVEAPLQQVLDAGGASAPAAQVERLKTAIALAKLGEGFCSLAGGQSKQALSWFQTRIDDPQLPLAARYAATLGYAEALLADSQQRKAQVWFARLAAVDHSNRDRAARALVGMALAAQALQDSDGPAMAKRWLTEVTQSYGDTTSAKKAAEMLNKL